MKLENAPDLKSDVRKGLRVRFPLVVPTYANLAQQACILSNDSYFIQGLPTSLSEVTCSLERGTDTSEMRVRIPVRLQILGEHYVYKMLSCN